MKEADWKALLKDGAAVLGLRLNAFQTQSLYAHMREMQHWNRRINLTAINAPEEIAIKHYLDAIAPSGQIPDQARLLDVGSGAGFPGIPLKIARPGCHLTMIDRARKRVNFLRHVVRQLELDQVAVHNARIETFTRIPGAETQFDCVVSRAFTRAADLARMVLPLLHGGAGKGTTDDAIKLGLSAGNAGKSFNARMVNRDLIQFELSDDVPQEIHPLARPVDHGETATGPSDFERDSWKPCPAAHIQETGLIGNLTGWRNGIKIMFNRNLLRCLNRRQVNPAVPVLHFPHVHVEALCLESV